MNETKADEAEDQVYRVSEVVGAVRRLIDAQMWVDALSVTRTLILAATDLCTRIEEAGDEEEESK